MPNQYKVILRPHGWPCVLTYKKCARQFEPIKGVILGFGAKNHFGDVVLVGLQNGTFTLSFSMIKLCMFHLADRLIKSDNWSGSKPVWIYKQVVR